MVELIVIHDITHKQVFKKMLTMKELGEALVKLSTKYILVFSTVRSIEPDIGCVMHLGCVDRG